MWPETAAVVSVGFDVPPAVGVPVTVTVVVRPGVVTVFVRRGTVAVVVAPVTVTVVEVVTVVVVGTVATAVGGGRRERRERHQGALGQPVAIRRHARKW